MKESIDSAVFKLKAISEKEGKFDAKRFNCVV